MNYDRLWLLGQNVWPMQLMAFNECSLYTIRNFMLMDEVRWGWELLTCTLFWMWDTFIHGTHMQRVWVDVLFEQHSTLRQIVWCHPTKVLVRTNTSCISKLTSYFKLDEEELPEGPTLIVVKNASTKIHLVMLAYYMWEEVPGREFIPC